MKIRNLFASALVGGMALVGGLEARAQTTNNLPEGATNVSAGPVTSNASLDLARTTQHLFQASSGVGGYLQGGNVSNWFDKGYSTNLVAIPNEGYSFASWSSGSTDPTKSVILNDPTNLFANFSSNSYEVVFRDAHNGVDVTNTFGHGASFTTNFPEYVYTGNGTRYKATSIVADGIAVTNMH